MGKTITFFGSMGAVGTSMIATSCAQELAKLKKRVLLIYASSQPGDDYIRDDTQISIDDLRRKDVITADEVKAVTVDDACRFHYIKTVREITQIKYFSPRIISSIAGAVGREYDYILVDGGSDIQYPLTAASLIAAEKRFFVMTGTMKSLNRFHRLKDILFMPKGMYQGAHIIENKYDKSEGSMATPLQIQQRFALPCIEVPYVKGGARAEADHRTLLGKGDYDRAVRNISGEIMNQGGEYR